MRHSRAVQRNERVFYIVIDPGFVAVCRRFRAGRNNLFKRRIGRHGEPVLTDSFCQ